MVGDRVFAFSQGLDADEAKLFEKSPDERKGKWNKILTLKNSPVLNKYNFVYENNKLTLNSNNKDIISISTDNPSERLLLANKLMELESSLLKPIVLSLIHI